MNFKKVTKKLAMSLFLLGFAVSSLFSTTTTFASDALTQVDGYLSTIHQGSVGDCGAISAIQALDNSTYGKSIFQSLITVKTNGSYTLNFALKKQTVTQNDVRNAYVTGDLDARVIEAGLQKAMHVYNGCFACDVFTTITGFPQLKYYNNQQAKHIVMQNLVTKFASGNGAIGACDFTIADDSKGIIGNGGHSYSIRWVDQNNVYVINPWDTSKIIAMSRRQFEDSVRYLCYVDEANQKVIVYWS